MVSISASVFGCDRRVRSRVSRSASSASAAVALRRVWANPACWAVCRPTEWVRITRRRRPSTTAVVSNAVRFSPASAGTRWWSAAGRASSPGWSLGGTDPTKCGPSAPRRVTLGAEFWPVSKVSVVPPSPPSAAV